eukprot:9985204-Alexandrium_andersonii.AAC.1
MRPQERPSPPGATRTSSTAHGPAPVARFPKAAPAPRTAGDGSPGGLSLRAWAARRTVEPSAAGGGRGTKRAAKEKARVSAHRGGPATPLVPSRRTGAQPASAPAVL